jgi:hypothetical protein
VKLPTAADYRDAIQNPQDCFLDPELRAGTAVADPLGLPRAISGNFASVFQLVAPNDRRYAVRCFVRYAEDQQQRYDAIAAFLAGVDWSWKVGFEFLAHGIRIRGTWFPVLKMEWVDAQPLTRYLAAHLNDPRALVALAERFSHAVADLQQHGAAHGDLQHGNLLVSAEGMLKLIDYDGMFVPGLSGREGHELGHRNYQHPARSPSDFGPGLDNFSAWVIYASLLALAVDPGLWSRLDVGEERLLFSRDDYVDPSLGLAFRALELSGDRQLAELAEIIKANLTRGPLSAAELHTISVTPEAAAAFAVPLLADGRGGAPNWIEDGGVDGGQAQVGAAWVVSHLPVPEPVKFSKSAGAARNTAIALVLATLLLLGLALVQTVPIDVAAAIGVSLLVAGAGVTRLAFIRTPELKDKRGREQWAKEAHKARKERAKERERLNKTLRGISDQERKLTERVQRASAERQQAITREVQRQQQSTQRQLAGITTRRRELITARQQREAQALRSLQEAAYQRELSRIYIGSGRIRGIGDALTASLAAYGIRTAADFVGVRTFIPGGGYRGRSGNLAAAIVLQSGNTIQVRGIGPTKAEALDRWRISMRARVQGRIPGSLPAAERQQIAAQSDGPLRALDTEEQQAHRDGQARVAELTARHRADEARAAAETRHAQAKFAVERQSLMVALQRADQARRDAELAAQQADHTLLPYREITFKNFILPANRRT